MATTITTHCKMGIVDSSGNVNVLYPQTTGSDVSITANAAASGATTVQALVNALTASAFIENFTGINDQSTTSQIKTWSANKIASEISELNSKLGDTDISGIGDGKVTGSISFLNSRHKRTPKQFDYDATKLSNAASDQDLEKYGYSLGDYFMDTNGYKYVLADMNTYYGAYDSYAVLNTKHIGILVVTNNTSKWNNSDSTSSGYNGSVLHSYLKGTVLPRVKTKLGSGHVLSHQKVLTTATQNWAWQTGQEISALTEVQVYGSRVFGIDGMQTGEGCKKLEVFDRFYYPEIFGNQSVWLRSIGSASHACCAGSHGGVANNPASAACGVVGLILFH